MKLKFMLIGVLCCVVVLVQWTETRLESCTTAIINGAASEQGVPILWKNRDTGFQSNKVIYVSDLPYCYVGLVNAEETSGRWMYAGLNSMGFGILNSVSYNLPKAKSNEMKDLEGQIMADALRTCASAADFETYIRKNQGPALGSWANFGIIDAQGNAVIFEVYNHGYKKYDAVLAPEHYLINSNFARSGEQGKGAGYLRFDRASVLFKLIPPGKITTPVIFQRIARDFGHTLLEQPSLDDLKDMSCKKQIWVLTRDTINRTSTSATAVIYGKKPGDKSSVATFWILLGEPVTSIAVPVWVEAKETPEPLYEGDSAPLCAEALRIKKIIRPFTESDREQYMEITRLDNRENTGYLPLLLKTEREIFRDTEQFLKTGHTSAEYAQFQNQMAQRALDTLKQIQ
jgi:hypothetical protein